jgi:hypothetical protein
MMLDVDAIYSFHRRLAVSDVATDYALDRAYLASRRLREPDRLRRVAAFARGEICPKKKLAPGLDHSEYRLVPGRRVR